MNKFVLEKFLSELEYLTNIDSGSRDVEGITKIADFFENKYALLGWKIERYVSVPEAGPCLVITNSDKDCHDIFFLGHMDTVFDKGEAEKRPFKVIDRKAYGPGVIDMKASLLSLYYVLESINDIEGLSLCILLNSDEEIGSRFSKHLISKLAAKSRCALVIEPAREDGSLVLERKGVGTFTVEFHGQRAHAGIEPEKGINAIEEMAYWIIEMQKLNNPQVGTSVNVGVVNGGTVGNVVPDYAVLKADVRFMDTGEFERVTSRIDEMRLQPRVKGVKVDVSGRIGRPPMKAGEKTINLCRIVEETAGAQGIDIKWTVTGGCSDGNFVSAAGIPVLDGMGPVGGSAHSKNEYLDIDSLKPRMELLREAILRICKRIE